MKTLEGFMSRPKDDVIVGTYREIIITAGGWNPHRSPVTDREVYQISNLGRTAVRMADAPWATPRNNGGCQELEDRVRIWGADAGTGPVKGEVWDYFPETDEWTLVLANLQNTVFGERQAGQHCVHKGYLYTHGGIDGPANIVRSADGVNWSVVANSPYYPHVLGMGAMVSWRGSLFLIGGILDYGLGEPARQMPGKVYRSDDDGVTWTLVVTDTIFQSWWCDAVGTNEAMFFLHGTVDLGTKLSSKLYVSYDGFQTWSQIARAPTPRHATGMVVINGEVYLICGYLHNDIWRVKLVATSRRYFRGKP